MRPELFVIPGLNISIKSYGTMMVLGFLVALTLARFLAQRVGENPDRISSFCVLTLIAGVVGARLMHVLHRLDYYQAHPMQVFALWSGGLEFLGGFVLAVLVTIWYFKKHKLPMWRFLDILAPAVMLGLAFGRVGCLMNGCCFGGPTDLPWAIRFPVVNGNIDNTGGCQHSTMAPYYSHSYYSQITPDSQRRPDEPPLIKLGDDYYQTVYDRDGAHRVLKNPDQLTDDQLEEMRHGCYHMLPIHPTQIYSSVNAIILAGVLYWLFARRRRDGQTFAIMLILYGPSRFIIESLRTDSPLEFNGLTISQNLGIAAVILGIVLLIFTSKYGALAQPASADDDGPKQKTSPSDH